MSKRALKCGGGDSIMGEKREREREEEREEERERERERKRKSRDTVQCKMTHSSLFRKRI